MVRLLLASVLLATANAALADDICQAALTDIGGGAVRPGVYVPTDLTLQHWRPMLPTETIASGRIPIAYFRPGDYAGAIVVKITKKMEVGDSPAQVVTVRRHDSIAQCDTGAFTGFVWGLFPKSYEDGIPVNTDDYLRYHRDRIANADLERFHIKYIGRDNVCLASNDPSNGNRAEFLFSSNRSTPNPYVATLERASGTDSAIAGGALKASAVAETVLAVYSAEAGCASFEFRSSGAGSYALRVNDLERRGSDGSRLKKELKRTFIVTDVAN